MNENIKKAKAWIHWFCELRARSTCFFDTCCGMDWSSCSAMHDMRYLNQRLTKKQADKLLYRCVKRKANTFFAVILWLGVSTPFGWYFYNVCKKNKKLGKGC